MITERAKYVLTLTENESGKLRPPVTSQAIYPMLMCLDNDELIDLYLAHFDSRLETRLVGVLIKRMESSPKGTFDGFLLRIVQLMGDVDYSRYRKLRAHLRQFLLFGSEALKSSCFDFFIHSERNTDRQVACEAAQYIWSKAIESRLWECWYQTSDKGVIQVLIQHADPIRLAEVFPAVWNSDSISWRVQRQLAERLAEDHLDLVRVTCSDSPLTYIHLAAKNGRLASDDEMRACRPLQRDEDDFGFWLYLLGLTRKWILLVSVIAENEGDGVK